MRWQAVFFFVHGQAFAAWLSDTGRLTPLVSIRVEGSVGAALAAAAEFIWIMEG